MNEIPELPDLVLLKVFSFFGISQRLRLRLVCKRWCFLVDQARQSTLCLYEICYPMENDLSPNRELEVWPDEMVWIETEREENTNEENELDINLEATFLRKLERLFLYRLLKPDNLISQANRLDRLKELSICVRVYFERLKLEPKNLEVLSIRETGVDYLELNTPRLSTLVLWKGYGRRQVKVLFPDKVTFLECEEFTIDLKEFTNLETLLIRKQAVNLDDHPKLKVFDLRDHEKELWENLREQASARKDLTIYSFGFRNLFCPRSDDRPVKIHESFLSEHYALLERRIPFEMDLDYNWSLLAFGGSITKSLLQLINITNINVWSPEEQPVNHLHLISLLKESKCDSLSIHTELPPEFFKLLPDCMLSSLHINVRYQPDSLELDFIPKLTNLRYLILTLNRNAQELPFDSFCDIIQNCRLLSRFFLKNRLADKTIFDMELAFKDFKHKTIQKFKVNGKKIQMTTKEEIIRYLKENAGMLQPSGYLILQ